MSDSEDLKNPAEDPKDSAELSAEDLDAVAGGTGFNFHHVINNSTSGGDNGGNPPPFHPHHGHHF